MKRCCAGDGVLQLENVIGTVFLKKKTFLTQLARNSLISEFWATGVRVQKTLE